MLRKHTHTYPLTYLLAVFVKSHCKAGVYLLLHFGWLLARCGIDSPIIGARRALRRVLRGVGWATLAGVAGAFFAGVFFGGAFFAGVFLGGAFFAGVFLGGAFFAGVLRRMGRTGDPVSSDS